MRLMKTSNSTMAHTIDLARHNHNANEACEIQSMTDAAHYAEEMLLIILGENQELAEDVVDRIQTEIIARDKNFPNLMRPIDEELFCDALDQHGLG